jgi:hypothetical protein
MPRFDLPQQGTFMQLAGAVATYIDPFEAMWPFYWLKMAAVRDGDIWSLCHFSLVGRWSDVEPIRPVRDRGDALHLQLLRPARCSPRLRRTGRSRSLM